MISFKSRCETVKNADRIIRQVNSLYPSISDTKPDSFISRQILLCNDNFDKAIKLSRLKNKVENIRKEIQKELSDNTNSFLNIIKCLKDKKVGNCFEKAKLAEFISKANGQDNVYTVRLLYTQNSSGAVRELDHVVTLITNKPLNKNNLYTLKNKEGIIVDPWLGITEFASNYFTKVQNEFRHLFPKLPDNSIAINKIKKESKNTSEYKDKIKEKLFKPKFMVQLHERNSSAEEIENLKKEFPELITENFKIVSL